MNKLGATKNTSVTAKKLATAFSGAALFIVIVWLFRGLLDITSYSLYLLLAVLALLLLDRVLRTKTNAGGVRAVSSFFWNMLVFCVYAIVLIWVLNWIASLQKASFPSVLLSYIPDLVIAGLVTGITAYIIGKVAPKAPSIRTTGKPLRVNSGASVNIGRAKVSTISDGVAIPMSFPSIKQCYALFSNVAVSLETPMGVKDLELKSPVILSGVPFEANKASEQTVRELTGKSSRDLGNVAKSIVPMESDYGYRRDGDEETVDLPFLHVREGGGREEVDIGPLSVRSDSTGERVEFGPFGVSSEGRHHRHRSSFYGENDGEWFAYSQAGPSKISSRPFGVSAKWNGSSMLLQRDFMKLDANGDGFEYSPLEVRTSSPLHTLRVTQSNISLETSKFAINVHSDKVIVRTTEGKSTSTESQPLANDLRSVLSELAMKQVRDVMAGEPIDLEELLSKTEEVLAKYE